MRKILKRELAVQLEPLGQVQMVDAAARFMSKVLMAKYEPATHTVHFCPERFEDETLPILPDEKVGEPMIRVLLAHEATHAHDWPRYHWSERLSHAKSADWLKASDAVSEGHAQYVAKRAAKGWGTPEAFEKATRAITYVPPVGNTTLQAVVNAMSAELTFSYVQGHKFVEAVAAAGGRPALEKLLANPPASTRDIEHPDEYLDPDRRAKTPDLGEALDAFAPLVGDPSWTTSKGRIHLEALRGILPTVPKENRATFLQGFQDGQVLVGRVPGGSRQLVAMLLWFDTPENALVFLAAERATQEAKDSQEGIPGVSIESAEYDEGAGAGGRLQGFLSHKKIRAGTQEIAVEIHTFLLGPLFGQVLRTEVPQIQRADEDAAIARLQLYLNNAEAVRAAHVFDVPAIDMGSGATGESARGDTDGEDEQGDG